MYLINSKKLATALGLVFALFYIGCMLLMWIVGESGIIYLFNSVLHGLDVSSVVSMNILPTESFIGLLITFGLGWIGGYLIGIIYNMGTEK